MKNKPNSKRGIPSLVKKSQGKLFVIDFCNLKEFSHEYILDLQKKYSVIHTKEDEKRGYSIACCSIHDERNPGTPDHRWILINKRELKMFPKHSGFEILPSEDDQGQLFIFLKRSQAKYKNFLTKCIDGNFDLKFVLDIMEKVKKGLTLKSIKDWEVSLETKGLYLSTFESHIDWQIINLFLHGKGEIFKHVLICDWNKCGKYFLSSYGAKHCSTTCANNKTSHKYRHTAHGRKKHREYMQEHTFSGVYVKKEKLKRK